MDSHMKPDMPTLCEHKQHRHADDEIDLLEVWKILAHRKWWIFLGTLFCTLAAVVIVLLMPREYRVSVSMSPPLPETVEQLNVPNVLLDENGNMLIEGYFFQVDIWGLYGGLIDNLKNSQLQLQFFRENKLVDFLSSDEDARSSQRIFQQEFRNKLTVRESRDRRKKRGVVTISLEGRNAEKIAEWLNVFVQLADKQAIISQRKIFNAKKQQALDYLSMKIQSMRLTERTRRLDKIIHLEEDIAVAKKINKPERLSNPDILYENVTKGNINISLNPEERPLFIKEASVLQAEIDVLKQRKDDDPFISELRNVQEKRDLLSSIVMKTDNSHSMRINSAEAGSSSPIKPKRKLIILLGFLFGLLSSISVVLFQNIFLSEKTSEIYQ